MLWSYWIVAAARQDRYWFVGRRTRDTALFVLSGLVLAVVSEYTAVHYRALWRYSKWMPMVPSVGIGLTPLLQWLVLPMVVNILLVRSVSGRKGLRNHEAAEQSPN
jgi:hypothetical protein